MRYRNPNSIRRRQPIILFDQDPRAKTVQKYESFQGKSGTDVFVLKTPNRVLGVSKDSRPPTGII